MLQGNSTVTFAGGTQYASYSKLMVLYGSINITDSSSAAGQGYSAQGLGGAKLRQVKQPHLIKLTATYRMRMVAGMLEEVAVD